MHRQAFDNREDWLQARREGIGASDAAAILGYNPWVSIDQLFDEKTGKRAPADLSGNKAVQYGIEAEPLIRELVRLDLPRYEIEHHAFDILHHDEYPFIMATLDGELTDKETGERGVLEIKTGSYRSQEQLDAWSVGKIPDHYFCQVIQQLLVTGWPFAIVAARLKRDPYADDKEGLPSVQWLYRKFVALQYEQSMRVLLQADIRFWESVQKVTRPGTIIRTDFGDQSWK